MSSKSYTGTSRKWARPAKVTDEFFKYALNRGLELTRDDKKWLECLCSGLPDDKAREALRGYIRIWLEKGKTDIDGELNQNQGRFEANTFIRKLLG